MHGIAVPVKIRDLFTVDFVYSDTTVRGTALKPLDTIVL